MQFMLLIYRDEATEPDPRTPEGEAHMGGYMTFTKEIRENGMFVAGDPLENIDKARTVRVRDGKAKTTDGPFAETKEQLGGFYILDCKNEAQALEYAAKIPSAKNGSIEVRPIMVFG